MAVEAGSAARNVAAEKSVPAFWRQTFGIRHPGIPVSKSATASRVVRWILPGWLTSTCQAVGQIGRHRQHRAGLVGIGNQVDDDVYVLLEDLGIILVCAE